MNSKELMRAAMTGGKPPRTPVMCQLALGHIYKNLDIGPFEFWYTTKGLAQGYVQIAEKYKFDGILTSKLGWNDNPALKEQIKSIVRSGEGYILTWKDERQTYFPPDDDPRDVNVDRASHAIQIADIDMDAVRKTADELITPYYLEPLQYVIAEHGADLSIHGEVGTVLDYFMMLLGSYEYGLLALADDPDKSLAIMSLLNQKVIRQARVQCGLGIDALKLSSPFAGAGFISRSYYKTFVLPFEKELIDVVHKEFNVPCYIHTCGAIGDRLDIMVETNTDGLECLDPPPLGNIDLEQAIGLIGEKVFIKGNLDSVNELTKPLEELKEIVRKRLVTGQKAKGYILSSACSVSPKVPPENVMVLHELACEVFE